MKKEPIRQWIQVNICLACRYIWKAKKRTWHDCPNCGQRSYKTVYGQKQKDGTWDLKQ